MKLSFKSVPLPGLVIQLSNDPPGWEEMPGVEIRFSHHNAQVTEVVVGVDTDEQLAVVFLKTEGQGSLRCSL